MLIFLETTKKRQTNKHMLMHLQMSKCSVYTLYGLISLEAKPKFPGSRSPVRVIKENKVN